MSDPGTIWLASKQTTLVTSGIEPSYQAIVDVWRAAADFNRRTLQRPGQPAAEGVHWIGPYPRVTRSSGVSGVITTVVWPFRIPSGVPADMRAYYAHRFVNGVPTDASDRAAGRAFQVSLDSHVAEALPVSLWERVSGSSSTGSLNASWQDATVTPFSPEVNGPLSWWESGQASQTMTREHSRPFTVDQNPYGPDTPEVTPENPLDTLKNAGDGLKTALIIGAIILVPIAFASFAGSAEKIYSKFKEKPRKNPNGKSLVRPSIYSKKTRGIRSH